MSVKRVKIHSVGSAVPNQCIQNDFFESKLNTSDEWIVQRTGIKTRYFVPEEERFDTSTSKLGAKALKKALDNGNLTASDLDTIVCATFSPDYVFPSTASLIASQLGAYQTFAFDIAGACAGFLYGLNVANSLILSGQSRCVALVGAEVLSKTLDFNDRSTAILFGDAAGAVILTASDDEKSGILDIRSRGEAKHKDILSLSMSGNGQSKWIMHGQELFKAAVRFLAELTHESLAAANFTVSDVDYFIPHQANIRIVNALADSLKIPREKLVTNMQKYGNTSAASIPLALDQVCSEGKIKKETLVGFCAIGGGLTVASALVRF